MFLVIKNTLMPGRAKATRSHQLDTKSLVYQPERPMGFVRRSDPAFYYLSRR